MCTRFHIDSSPEIDPILEAARQSHLRFPSPLLTSGDILPTNVAAALAPNKQGEMTVYPMQWGFQTGRSLLLNARTETAAEKPTFRDAWQSHRCIIPASYYYEWEHPAGQKTRGDRHSLRGVSSAVTWLCGVYRIENGLPHFVVLTREPDENIRYIHDRMPLILPGSMLDAWIRPESNPELLVRHAMGVEDLNALRRDGDMLHG